MPSLTTNKYQQSYTHGPRDYGRFRPFRIMKNSLRDIFIPFIVVVVALAGTCYLYSTAPDDHAQDTSAINPGTTDVQEYFNEKLRKGVVDRIGQPIEGFVPFMFLQALSGIVPKDFGGADALLGKYRIVENELIFILDEGDPIHSAAETLSEEGMKTVFANIQRRTNVLITTTDEVDRLLLFLGVPPDLVVTECLPEQRDVEACIEIYQPVCATVNVQCITTPCDPVLETFANSCKACMNSLVSTYTQGVCPVDFLQLDPPRSVNN